MSEVILIEDLSGVIILHSSCSENDKHKGRKLTNFFNCGQVLGRIYDRHFALKKPVPT
jgi:hypothetical protein